LFAERHTWSCRAKALAAALGLPEDRNGVEQVRIPIDPDKG
jgi:hypothetical protein